MNAVYVRVPIDDEYREDFPKIGEIIRRKAQQSCNRNLILNQLPILKWFPEYRRKYFYADFVAGITVGLTAIPQGIAYAVVAGLPPQYGLYAGFIGCFVYLVFGSCKDITIGPTAIMALMVQRYVAASPDYAILMTFLTGCIIFACGLLNLGFLIQFISIPVTAGFTTAAAITIASGQVRSLLGISGKSNEFIESWKTVINGISETRLWDTVLGVTTVIFLLILKKLNDIRWRRGKMFFKYLSLSRNALAVIGGILIAYIFELNGYSPFIITGEITAGFPPVRPPKFSTNVNGTDLSFGDMISELGSSIVAVPLVSILESIAVAKAFSKGKLIDATQEMLALGLCNIVGSFFSSMPTTGSFTRTALNNASGVRTPLGGIFTGGLVILAVVFLTETFRYIPKATLAAVIITAMFYMLEFKLAYEIWKIRRIDVLPFVVALIACLLLGLDYGILLGILANTLFILYNTARPNSSIETVKVNSDEVLLIRPNQSLPFSSAEYLRNKILKHAIRSENVTIVVINGQLVHEIDATVAINLKQVSDDLKLQNKQIWFWNWRRQPIGTAHRLSSDFGALFKNSERIEDVVGENVNVIPVIIT